MTPTVNDQEIARRFAELTAATETLIAAEATYIVAISADGPLSTEAAKLATATLDHARALLAVQLANGNARPGVKRIVSIERKFGADWIPMVGGGECEEARPRETASAQAVRHAFENNILDSDRTWRVLVWTDPRPGAMPDGEWSNLTARLATEPAFA